MFMSTHSFVLSAGAVDAVIATAALCFPPSTAVGDLVSNTLMVQIGDGSHQEKELIFERAHQNHCQDASHKELRVPF